MAEESNSTEPKTIVTFGNISVSQAVFAELAEPMAELQELVKEFEAERSNTAARRPPRSAAEQQARRERLLELRKTVVRALQATTRLEGAILGNVTLPKLKVA